MGAASGHLGLLALLLMPPVGLGGNEPLVDPVLPREIASAVRFLPTVPTTRWSGGRVGWQDSDPQYREQRFHPPERTWAGFRLDKSYKNATMVGELLAAYARRFPHLAALERFGTSVEGRPLLALKISDHVHLQEVEPTILLDGSHHANELVTTEIVLDAIETLLSGYERDPMVARFVNEFEIWCVPLVNPDGNHAFMELSTAAGRKNNRDTNGDGQLEPYEGVDLNRNYPFRWGALGENLRTSQPHHSHFRGTAPASEPETAAMMALARRERFVAAISYHSKGTVIMPPYAALGIENPVNDEAWPIAEAMAAASPRQVNGRRFRVQRRLYPVEGVLKDWLRSEIGTVAFVVEAAAHNPRDPKRRRATVAKTRSTWQTMLTRFLDGPSLAGRVFSEDGRPLEAEVRIEQIVPRAGERWTSRPRDGFFARYLPSPGAYTVRVEAGGHKSAEVQLEINGQRSELDFVLRRTPPLLAVAD